MTFKLLSEEEYVCPREDGKGYIGWSTVVRASNLEDWLLARIHNHILTVSSIVPIIGGTSTLVLMLEYQFIISVGGIPSPSD